MDTQSESPLVSRTSLIHLPEADSLKWVTQQLATNANLKTLHDHFQAQGFVFYLERAQVFVSMARDAAGNLIPAVLGILPSFVPTTAVDKSHLAVGISVNHTGDAVAATVNVNHSPFGVTDFTLHVIDHNTKEIVETTLSKDDIVMESLKTLAEKIRGPFGGTKSSKGKGTTTATASGIDQGDQAAMISITIHTLLSDKYSKGLFPPAYAAALSAQIPIYQKFAFIVGRPIMAKEGEGGVTICTSTSSNICTSTSTIVIGG